MVCAANKKKGETRYIKFCSVALNKGSIFLKYLPKTLLDTVHN